ncbi:M48 family metallopeptidase [Elizabethkingia meningoseptica]|uniref:M48 family metallopeptidase n=1 Tax=Elizabethkingia meningoseptica TaxID=238 RepID=UPI000332CE8A|nr:M48 family metallopeptidase [Elizabethkingia meningoseptica]AQX04510.1 peptidase M48 [Elizabethkingia meningoseptica]AQX46551.1 peptidase M48 [Elizabethkingia meningoseptica]EJK5328550.1 M48 family metallopeptidase [Elizabethkingia meningoseptica]EJK5330800.1 M48 family metallopeptidase [Elizabethkingia meningoseptica]EOR31489.1 zn-dependent protease with chaperone function [Elizabethkingia meningoseptica ATCC 13253 = NBRC 12535]
MKLSGIIGITAMAATLTGCVTNPITGRQSIQIADTNQINATSFQEYKTTLSKSKVVTGADANRVKAVGQRIANAVRMYYRSIGREQDLANYQWEFNLIQDKQLNAWCMPGGKVAVYTGILPVTKDDAGLAVVMGHEISHALAGHGNERISQATLAQYGGQLVGASISNGQMASIFQQLYPVGAQVGLLAYGRKQESEADQMGLYLMAMAGYDPRTAPAFWQRMQDASGGGSGTPAFLSTHPNPANRKAALEAMMPKALEYYRAAGGK